MKPCASECWAIKDLLYKTKIFLFEEAGGRFILQDVLRERNTFFFFAFTMTSYVINVIYKVLFIFSTMIPFLQHFSTVIVPTEKWFLQSLTITKWLDIIFLFKYQKIFWNFTHFKCTQCLMANIGSYYRWNINFPELKCFFSYVWKYSVTC